MVGGETTRDINDQGQNYPVLKCSWDRRTNEP